MAYNTSTGSRDFDDMRYQQDRDTQIDWDQDSISFKTNDILRLTITNSHVSSSINLSASVFYGDAGGLTNVPAGNPAGSDTQIQYNNGGSFGASSNLIFNGTVVKIGGNLSGSGTCEVVGATILGNTLSVSGAATLAGDTTFTNISGSGTIQSVDHVYVGNNLFISGNIDIAGGFSLGSDAEGDMYYRNSAGVLTRLPRGSNNNVMTMNGTVPNWEVASGITFNGSTANGLVTFGNASTADVESDILFNAGNLTMNASISGSGTLEMVGNTYIGGDLKASGSLRAKQIQTTHHAWTTTSINAAYVPFYDLAEHTATSPGYKVGMIAPFNGRLLRVLFRPQSGQAGAVTVGVHTGSNTEGGVTTTPIEEITITPVNAAYTTSVYNFTMASHFSAEQFIGVSIDPNNSTSAATAVCVWEFDMSEI